MHAEKLICTLSITNREQMCFNLYALFLRYLVSTPTGIRMNNFQFSFSSFIHSFSQSLIHSVSQSFIHKSDMPRELSSGIPC